MVKFSASRSGGTILPRSFSIFSVELNWEAWGRHFPPYIQDLFIAVPKNEGKGPFDCLIIY